MTHCNCENKCNVHTYCVQNVTALGVAYTTTSPSAVTATATASACSDISNEVAYSLAQNFAQVNANTNAQVDANIIDSSVTLSLQYLATKSAQLGGIIQTLPNVVMNTSCTATAFNASSDYRIKEVLTELKDKSEFSVDELRPVHYFNKKLEKEDIGFIAHEVQEVFPYLVEGTKDGEELQSVNYIGLIGILVKEIQELKKRVSDLESA